VISEYPGQVVRIICVLLAPLIMMFGIYVIAHGHYGPGGGFAGGIVVGVGIILLRITTGPETSTSGSPRSLVRRPARSGVLGFIAPAPCRSSVATPTSTTRRRLVRSRPESTAATSASSSSRWRRDRRRRGHAHPVRLPRRPESKARRDDARVRPWRPSRGTTDDGGLPRPLRLLPRGRAARHRALRHASPTGTWSRRSSGMLIFQTAIFIFFIEGSVKDGAAPRSSTSPSGQTRPTTSTRCPTC
jgi:hypothetical protein